MKEWICEEVPAVLVNGKVLTTMMHQKQELVRCKDCIFGKHEKNESTGMTWIYCGHHMENRPKDWFCASGSPTIKQEGR